MLKTEYQAGQMRIPVKLWADNIEGLAVKQITNLANLPFAFHHIAIMPDCHSGYGMPIGGVLATPEVVIPNAVGVDIGCGVCAIKTPWTSDEIDKEMIKKIIKKIRETVPVGFAHHKVKQPESCMPQRENLKSFNSIVIQEEENAKTQIGTLGGGNHFIEIQKDSDKNIWIMIHSGSRNLGKKVADYYNKLAVGLDGKWPVHIPKEWELAFLPLDSQEGKYYLAEMNYCLDFALANRKLMLQRIVEAFYGVVQFKTIGMLGLINIAHNYSRMENHYGQDVMVHRKGATSAKNGEIGIVPGSQGSKSYIVKGLGNPESFQSCAHGAGRKMGRGQAIQNLSLEEEIRKLDEQGILHSIRKQKDLDEATGAYKPIDEVMRNQIDLVEILVELSPLAVIKAS
jgi:tRNA-splicing ligase RtcB (3'-phosphate/5'-hydroxy nucleic acid ligase)